MSVSIRLTKIGRKNAPAFRLVVANTRDKRDGRYIERIGSYNPSDNPPFFQYDKDKYEKWVKEGAIVSKAVQELIEGTYTFKDYDPKGKKSGKSKAKTTDSENVSEPTVVTDTNVETEAEEEVTTDAENGPAEEQNPEKELTKDSEEQVTEEKDK